MSTPERANHSRWCDQNPKSKEYKEQLSVRSTTNNTGLKRSEETKEKLRELHRQGVYSNIDRSTWVPKKHSDETKELIRQRALASPHRRLKRCMIEYNGVMLDSTWELALARRLDELSIPWERPDPIIWFDDHGKAHHYFPDFYLPKQDIYLDPKNPIAVRVQQRKLDCLLRQHQNIKLLLSLEECMSFVP